MLFWHQTINGRFFVRAARFRSFHDQGVQNLALKISFDAQKQSNYAKSRAKYSSEIFSATMRDARFFPAYVKSPASAKTIASPVQVIRRVGGLEVLERGYVHGHAVIRRVGGLEVRVVDGLPAAFVIRRVGGLEATVSHALSAAHVIRRVGGLEACGRRNAALQLRYPPCRRVRKRPKHGVLGVYITHRFSPYGMFRDMI